MSIYASLPGITRDEPCGPPWQYQGSHILPADADPRGGEIGLALIPSHITRDGRDDQPEDGAPWPWLRLSLDDLRTADPTVVLDRPQVAHLVDQLTAWYDSTGDPAAPEQHRPDNPADTCGAIGTLDGPLPGHTARCYRNAGHTGRHRDQDNHEWEPDDELTVAEARDLVDELGTQLYRAEDALAFVGECCDIADREGRPVTTAQVREWLKGARCGRQLLADHAADTAPDDGQLRAQVEAALRESWRTSGTNVHMDDAIRRDADAVLPVITRHTQQLVAQLSEAENDLAQAEADRAEADNDGEQTDAALARVRDVIADMHGITGARFWANLLDTALNGPTPTETDGA